MTDQTVLFEKVGRTALITLNRPHRRNALDPAMGQVMLRAIESARDDADVRTVVMTGAGGAFCAGADLAGEAGTD